MSLGRTPSFHYHFVNCLVIFKNIQLGITLRRMCVAGHVIYLSQLINTFFAARCQKLLDVLFGFYLLLGLWVSRSRCQKLWWKVSYQFGAIVILVWQMSQRSNAGKPSIRNPASKDIISEVCFLHIQFSGTNVRLPDKHKTPPDVDFESSRSPAKSESWNKPSRQSCAVLPHMTVLLVVLCMMNVRNKSCQSSVTCLSPLCNCTGQFMDRPLSIRTSNSCKVEAFQHNVQAYFGQFTLWLKFLFFELVIIQARTWNFVQLHNCIVCQFTISVHKFLSMSFHVIRLCNCFCVRFFPSRQFFCCPLQKYVIQTSLCILQSWFSFGLHSRWVHPRYTWSKNDVGSSSSTSLTFISSTWVQYSASFQPFSWRQRIPTRIILVSCEQTDTPNSALFPSFDKTSSNCRAQNSPAKGWPCRFRSRGTTGSSILDHDFGHLCLGRRVHTSGHSDFGIFEQSWCILQFYLGACRYCISCLPVTIWQFCNYIHNFRRSHLWRRRPLLCEHSKSAWVIFDNVTTEYNTSFVLLKFLFQLRIFQLTYDHEWSQVDFSFVPLCLLRTFSSFQAGIVSIFFPFFRLWSSGSSPAHRSVSKRTPGRPPLRPSPCSTHGTSPICFPQTPFQCPRSRTATLGPYVGLTVHWAVSPL